MIYYSENVDKIEDILKARYLEKNKKKIPFTFANYSIVSETKDGIIVSNLCAANDFRVFNVFLADFCVTPQKWGPAAEKKYLEVGGINPINNKMGMGDGYHDITGNIEVKTSISFSNKFSVQQVRIDRPINYYLLSFYHSSSKYCFFGFVPSAIIKNLLGSQSHGTKNSVLGNKDREFSLKQLSITDDGKPNKNLSILEPWNYYGGGAHLRT